MINKELLDWSVLNFMGRPYGYTKSLPTFDFNREIALPGNIKFPEGAIIIRTDDNFFYVGCLPWCFINISLPDIVDTLWSFVPVEERVFRDDAVYR